MLEIVVAGGEVYDDAIQEFRNIKPTTLRLEHSLVSISKWEAKWKKPFLKKGDDKTNEELRDYIRCMTISQNVPSDVYYMLSKENVDAITEYMNTDQTATWFSDKARPSSRIITSEVIYGWMVLYGIPFECQKWHISRLFTLIHVCSIEQAGDAGLSKPNRYQTYSRNAALNAARKQRLNTKG